LDEAQVRSLHEGVMRLREELGVLYTQDGHCAGTLAFARDMGAIGPWSLMSHSIDLTEDDMSAAREADAVIVHNPSAIMSIRGRCPVPELLNMGVRVVLGSDGAAPDRGYDMFRHMAQCMHYHRRHFRDAKVLPAGKVLEMATIDAAAGLGRSEEIGSLEPGKRADVILVDLFKPHLVPINMAPMRIAHFANAADVDTVIVDGEILMRNRKVRTVDEAAVLEDAQAQMERIIRDNDMGGLLEMPSDFWGASGLSSPA
jgi:5-methylthioadenosine/S-adenosylhomocysteine deaminase